MLHGALAGGRTVVRRGRACARLDHDVLQLVAHRVGDRLGREVANDLAPRLFVDFALALLDDGHRVVRVLAEEERLHQLTAGGHDAHEHVEVLAEDDGEVAGVALLLVEEGLALLAVDREVGAAPQHESSARLVHGLGSVVVEHLREAAGAVRVATRLAVQLDGVAVVTLADPLAVDRPLHVVAAAELVEVGHEDARHEGLAVSVGIRVGEQRERLEAEEHVALHVRDERGVHPVLGAQQHVGHRLERRSGEEFGVGELDDRLREDVAVARLVDGADAVFVPVDERPRGLRADGVSGRGGVDDGIARERQVDRFGHGSLFFRRSGCRTNIFPLNPRRAALVFHKAIWR